MAAGGMAVEENNFFWLMCLLPEHEGEGVTLELPMTDGGS